KSDEQTKADSKADEGKQDQTGKAGTKQGQAKEGQGGANPGAGKGKGQQAKAGAKPGDPKAPQDMEKLAELEQQLSKEAAALAEKLEKLAGKDTRLGHNAGRKANQAAGQMGAAAQSLRQGNF